MSILPSQLEGITLSTEIEFVDYPTNTYYVDPIAKQIRGFTDGHAAMLQAIQIIFEVERYYFQIYTANFGFESRGLVGQDFGFVISDLRRRIDDAFFPDNRIRGTKNFVFTKVAADALQVDLVVDTVFGDINASMEVRV